MSTIGELISVGAKGRGLLKSFEPPTFERAEMGGMPPTLIATTRRIEDLLCGDGYLDNSPNYYLEDDDANGWCHELDCRLWIKNNANKLLTITGVLPNKKVIPNRYVSALVFPPQGSASGDVLRFECNLDSDGPSMR